MSASPGHAGSRCAASSACLGYVFLVVIVMLIVPEPSTPTPAMSPGRFRDLYIVAHQDDDLLFMNPDIQISIALGHTVRTIYMTAGDSCQGAHFWRDRREAGVMAAYAHMACAPNAWTVTSTQVLEVTLQTRPAVSLVFMRLPASMNELGADCPDGRRQHLRSLWTGTVETLTALDGSQTYTRSQLISALVRLMSRFEPDRLNTLDGSGLASDGRHSGDPSDCRVQYPGNRLYIHDHCEHYYSALFALASGQQYARPIECRRYRGYNIANEAANVIGGDLDLKLQVFMTYAGFDSSVLQNGRPSWLYSLWIHRQYLQQSAGIPLEVSRPMPRRPMMT
jgi:hypothetical protein